MNFNRLVEETINENKIYTITELLHYKVWLVRKKLIPIIKKQIKKDGFYDKGARVLVPVFKDDAPNILVAKTLELLKTDDNKIRVIKTLRDWAKDNIPPGWAIKHGYATKNDPYGQTHVLPLAAAKNVVELLGDALLVIPRSTPDSKNFETYVVNELYRITGSWVGSPVVLRYGFIERNGICGYKEYVRFEDKEVEQAWGDIIDGL